ncbi:MAG TPA: hypothetical protein PKE20_07205 [Promineifilum sp.]|nr:hypothetical protein [Promineifilum sp.]
MVNQTRLYGLNYLAYNKRMVPNAEAILADSAKRLFPSLSKDEALASLLLERAQRNLIKYQSQARQYEAKYQHSFDEFRRIVIDGEPKEEEEQDYFDWELAVTGATDMKREIDRLSELLDQ